ncbi:MULTISPECIES: hypothetical protein [Actinoplanes]|nr:MULTISPECIES: hypothetical protein [Actinoplanes]
MTIEAIGGSTRSATWRWRAGVTAVAAALAVTTVFGPAAPAVTRLGASEAIGFAVDSMTGSVMLTGAADQIRRTKAV